MIFSILLWWNGEMLFSIFLWWNGEMLFQFRCSCQWRSTHRNIFPLKILNFFHSFQLIFKNIVAICFFFAHSVCHRFLNIMCLSAPVRDFCWLSNSGCGDTDRSKFVRCVDRRDPEVHKVWIWGDDGITPEVHPTEWVDVNHWITRDFETNYFIETGSRTSIFIKKIINGSFDFLGVAAPLGTKGPYWIENLLCPSLSWVVGGTVEILNWGSQPGSRYGGVDVPWHGAVSALPAYLPRSP